MHNKGFPLSDTKLSWESNVQTISLTNSQANMGLELIKQSFPAAYLISLKETE